MHTDKFVSRNATIPLQSYHLMLRLLLIRPILFPFANLSIDRLRLRLLPSIREKRIVLRLIRILQQRLPRILIAHTTKPILPLDILLVRISFGERRGLRDVRASGIPAATRSRQADVWMAGGVAGGRGRGAAGQDDGVVGDALREVGGQVGVVVDVAAFGRAGHDKVGAARGSVRIVEDVGFAVGGASHDLV